MSYFGYFSMYGVRGYLSRKQNNKNSKTQPKKINYYLYNFNIAIGAPLIDPYINGTTTDQFSLPKTLK